MTLIGQTVWECVKFGIWDTNPQERSKEDIKNYILISITIKINNNRLQNTLEAAQPREQADFRSHLRKMDHIRTLSELIE